MILKFQLYILSYIAIPMTCIENKWDIDIFTDLSPREWRSFHNRPENAIDGDGTSSAISKKGNDPFWYMELNSTEEFRIKMISAKLKEGGVFTFYISRPNEVISNRKICKEENVTSKKVSDLLVECSEVLYGNRVWIQRSGNGYLILYDVKILVCLNNSNDCAVCAMNCTSINNQSNSYYLRQCPDGRYGYVEPFCKPCMTGTFGLNCMQKCPSCLDGHCDIINGSCNSCDKGKHGDQCQKNCSNNCNEDGCEQTSGKCFSCKDGYYGDDCDLQCSDNCNQLWCDDVQVITTDVCNTYCQSTQVLGHNSSKCLNSRFVTDEMQTSANCKLYLERICESRCLQLCNKCNGTITRCETQKSVGTDDIFGLTTKMILIIVSSFVFISMVTCLIVGLVLKKRYRNIRILRKPRQNLQMSQQTERHVVEDVVFQNTATCDAHIYQNITTMDLEASNMSVNYCYLFNRIPIDMFIDFAKELKESGKIKDEYKALPAGLLEDHSDAIKPANKSLTRYRKVYPYNHNRVVLRSDLAENQSDFINASYVHAYSKKHRYIAAQGPFTDKTTDDFWRMIWQMDGQTIVMLTTLIENDKVKCVKYWPEDELQYGQINVKLTESCIFPNFTRRTFELTTTDGKKTVTQFHFTTWPDKSVPISTDSINEFRGVVRQHATDDSQIVVHCSAGIGRTGTFIALDYLLDMAETEKSIDVIRCVCKLRHQRTNAVQSLEQYEFLYSALADSLRSSLRTFCESVST